MALDSLKPVTSFASGGADGQPAWLDPLAEQLQEKLGTFIKDVGQPGQDIKNFLHGIWLGHPLHPAMTDVPIGAWTTAAFLDLFGIEQGADAAIGLGIVAALPTAAAGMADWSDTEGEERRVGLVHALLNSAALGCYVGSLIARRAGNRGFGIGLSTAGLAVNLWSAYLGGELSYRLGQGVNRNAWRPQAPEFQVAAPADSLPEGQLAPGEITVEGEKVPLVLLKRGSQVFALNGVCAHLGGPLAEGTLVDGDCVECPWHGSRFNMQNGSVVQGPAAYPQPHFEARIRDGNVEVRQVE